MTTKVTADFEIDGQVVGVVYRADMENLTQMRGLAEPERAWLWVTGTAARRLIGDRRKRTYVPPIQGGPL